MNWDGIEKKASSRKQRQRKEPGYEVVGLATFGGRTSLSYTPRRVAALVRRPAMEAAGRHENGGTHLHHNAAEQQAGGTASTDE